MVWFVEVNARRPKASNGGELNIIAIDQTGYQHFPQTGKRATKPREAEMMGQENKIATQPGRGLLRSQTTGLPW
jgi:hypothetical protein